MVLSERDLKALATRNLALIEAKRRRTTKQKLRGLMLSAIARIPVKKQRGGTNRVLLIRPDHLGDLLLTVPAIRGLKHASPDLALHALVGAWGKQAIDRLPELSQIETLEFPAFTRQPKSGAFAPYQLAWETAKTLRKTGYDAAIILRPDHWWGAMLAYLAGIPRIIGFDLPDIRPFLTDTVPFTHQHSIEMSLALASVVAGKFLDPSVAQMHYPLSEDDHAQVDKLLLELSVPKNQPIVCIHPGSGTQTKQWDTSRWAHVGDVLAEKLGAFIIFTGSPSEAELCRATAQNMTAPHGIAAGRTSLNVLAAILARASVVLGPDSGPIHLASSVQAPTVALFGPADTVEFSTWGDKTRHAVLTSDIACLGCRILNWPDDAPENHPCVRNITLEQVIAAALRVAR